VNLKATFTVLGAHMCTSHAVRSALCATAALIDKFLLRVITMTMMMANWILLATVD